LVAVDGDVDVLLLHARDLGLHYVRLVFLLHVHADLDLRRGLEGHRPHEKALEQIVERLVERRIAGKVCHLSVSWYSGCTSGPPRPMAAIWAPAAAFQGAARRCHPGGTTLD